MICFKFIRLEEALLIVWITLTLYELLSRDANAAGGAMQVAAIAYCIQLAVEVGILVIQFLFLRECCACCKMKHEDPPESQV